MLDKLRPLQDLARTLADHQRRGEVVVHCHGVFDLLHPGHIRHLEAARSKGDVLVVTLTPDRMVKKGPGRPVYNERLRAETLAALDMVSYVSINRWPTACETIRLLKPDLYVKGGEYVDRDGDVTGRISLEEQAVTEVGGRLQFTNGITFSSTKLLNEYFDVFPDGVTRYLRGLRDRYTPDDVIELLRGLSGQRVLVVGDAIIDEYHFCQPLGMATKSNAINARFLRAEAHAGGALAVANHVAGFCESVTLVSAIGAGCQHGEMIGAKSSTRIDLQLIERHDVPTIVKRRYVDEFLHQKLFEVSFMDATPLGADQESHLVDRLAELIPRHDVVLVADFGHGLIGERATDALCAEAPFLALNTQTNSANVGYNLVTRYPRADYVCIDQGELRLACSDRFGALEPLVAGLAGRMGSAMVTVTRGHHGSTTLAAGSTCVHTPVFSREVVDTIGAGDAYLSVTALCAAAGYPAELVGFVGNCVGALAVRYLGNRKPVDPVTLFKFITTLLK